MNVTLDLSKSQILGENGKELIYEDIPSPINPYQQGQYSSNIASLSSITIQEIAYPKDKVRPELKELDEMQKRDPVVNQCIALKSLRAVQNFGDYSHPVSEIESFITSNLNTLPTSFRRTLFKMISSIILYGSVFCEYTLTSKARGFDGQWRLAHLNVLDPRRIQSVKGKKGVITTIVYDKGDGIVVEIPYQKILHIVNNSCSVFDEDEVWGVGDGASALNYYKLKRVVLTQLALATKNNATGIIHAKTPNVGRTVLIDSKRNPIKDNNGKPIEVTKQIALNYQLQDLYTKDYIVTDSDVDIQRIQIQNNERFWEYVLNYIDRSLQRSFAIPAGIFDNGMSGLQNSGLSQNYKSVFDSTIYALTSLLKEELMNKVIKRLLNLNYPLEWFKNNYGEFRFSADEDEAVVNSRLSTISSLVASGILEADIDITTLIKKKLGLPALDKQDKEKNVLDKERNLEKEDMQYQLDKLTTEMQMLQTQLQMQQLTNPIPPEGAGEDIP